MGKSRKRRDTEKVQLAIDGMYPVRNDSGICVSSVMARVNGAKKIIGKSYKKHSFMKKHSSKNGKLCLPYF